MNPTPESGPFCAENKRAVNELQRLRSDNAQLQYALEQSETRYSELRAELATLKHDIERHVQIAADLATENAALQERYDEEVAIVNRIWAMFGMPSYEELEGRTIYDLVQAAQNQATVMHDMHKALGIKWGDDPYAVIAALQADARRYRQLRTKRTSLKDGKPFIAIYVGSFIGVTERAADGAIDDEAMGAKP